MSPLHWLFEALGVWERENGKKENTEKNEDFGKVIFGKDF